jgi:chloramphenicol 3-O-phosphotransferase
MKKWFLAVFGELVGGPAPRAKENSPAIHRWVSVESETRVPKGTTEPMSSASRVGAEFFRPCGTFTSPAPLPAMNRCAMVGRPFGTLPPAHPNTSSAHFGSRRRFCSDENNKKPKKVAPLLFCVSVFAAVNLMAEPGKIVLLNGTSSAGKSSLAEVAVQNAKIKFAVVSFDDFHRSYREKHGLTGFNREQREDFRLSLYRHAKAQSEAGRNIIIDTVEFDLGSDKYCEILDCPKVIKAIVYCPLEHILKRIDRRNSADDPAGRRPVLLSFQQFLQMYKPQTSPDELVVEKTSTSRIRAALAEAGKKAGNPRQYEALYQRYVVAFGIDKDREVVVVPKGKYDLVFDTKASTKKENVRILDDYMRSRP